MIHAALNWGASKSHISQLRFDGVLMGKCAQPYGSLRRNSPGFLREKREPEMFDDGVLKSGDEIAEMQSALGAVAAGRPAVFWIFRKDDGRWYVRLEGDEGEQGFADRQAAQDFAKVVAARCRSYRVFAQQEDGAFTELRARWHQEKDSSPHGLLRWLARGKLRGFLT
jgi:hypothetical protein